MIGDAFIFFNLKKNCSGQRVNHEQSGGYWLPWSVLLSGRHQLQHVSYKIWAPQRDQTGLTSHPDSSVC